MRSGRFSLTQLRYFVAACETLSTARAAEYLGVSQASISTAITHLESVMGVALFVRVPAKGLSLTDDGREARRIAGDLLDRSDELLRFSDSSQTAVAGTVRIACFPTLIPSIFPPLFERVQAEHPDLRVELVEATYQGVLEQLRLGEVSFGLLYDNGVSSDFDVEYIGQCRPYVLLGEKHPLWGQSSVHLKQLDGGRYACLDLATSFEYVHELLRRAGARASLACETSSVEALRSVVSRTDAFAILNQNPMHEYATGGARVRAVAIEGTVEIATVAMVMRPSQPVSTRLKVVRDYIRAIGQEIDSAQLFP